MTEVGITELKTRTSDIIRRVRYANETFVVTYRGRPVAKLEPLEDTETHLARDLSILEEWTASPIGPRDFRLSTL